LTINIDMIDTGTSIDIIINEKTFLQTSHSFVIQNGISKAIFESLAISL